MQWLRTERQLINVDQVTRFAVVGIAACWELRAYFASSYHYVVLSAHGKEADAVAAIELITVRVLAGHGVIDLRTPPLRVAG